MQTKRAIPPDTPTPKDPALLARREAFMQQAEEPLRRARKFLYDLNARLLYYPPDVRASYAVDGFGTLPDLQQGDYQLFVPQGAERYPLSLGYFCTGSKGIVRQLAAGHLVIQQHEEYLRTRGLTYVVTNVFPDAGRGEAAPGERHVLFDIAPRVPVTVTVDVDPSAERIRIHAWNLERLGRVSYPVAAESMTDELLGELVKAILRQPNRLNALAGFEVPEDTRDELRKRIYLDARRKALELAGARQRSRGSLLGRIFGARKPEG
jgi:hypothetical protein